MKTLPDEKKGFHQTSVRWDQGTGISAPWRRTPRSLGVHEGVELALVAQLHLHDPVAEGVLVDQLGLVLKGLVDLNDPYRRRGSPGRWRLDALHGAEIVLGGELVIYLGHIDIDDIAQALLCVVGDTYIASSPSTFTYSWLSL